ncbi:hypothetical protein PP175_26340 (plasmid) [Aneurinibacillus sp. Ricciae_BoGa-3]|uniref:hypothetical protein n=1 Tax=Aneurinibacillus sp. Ricciae_BoGa-3 TaxID=3022697 RepID=UPI002341471A|nr:hypothetical protein [Aneurinibacillus sp. Ricciae_BoGa-3]WCK57587.1 hypothetical protein PP175_26340 [Aneurinibacillus sp. Ricciae_BoGa-3]
MMNTVLMFTESSDKQKVIIKHPKDVQITIETRNDPYEWQDSEGKRIEKREFVVIRYPKTKEIDLSKVAKTYKDRVVSGFHVQQMIEYVEVLLYKQITFTWNLFALEEAGLFRVSQRMIPDKEQGEYFPCYINPRGLKEVSYDVFFGLLQLPFQLYKQKKSKVNQL